MLGPRPRPPLVPFGSASDPDRATSDDFAAFDRNADAILSPRLNRRPEGAAGFQTLEYRPERGGVGAAVPLLQRVAQGSPGNPQPSEAQRRAAAEADARRKEMFEQWDKDPQKEIDAGRFLREKIFGAKAGKGNILQDPINMYDPEFSKAMREALKRATPDEIEVMNSMRPKNVIDTLRIAAPGGRISLTPHQKQQFVTMVERAGPGGQQIGSSARRYWGMENPQ